MIALYIILGIIILLTIILALPIGVRLWYIDGLGIKIKFLFFKYEFKTSKSEYNIYEAESDSVDEEDKKEDNKVDDFVGLMKSLAEAAVKVLKKLFPKVVIKEFDINMVIAGEDSASAALKYGYICSALYPLIGTIISNIKTKDYNINIFPDFSLEKTEIKFHMYAKVSLMHLLVASCASFIKFVKSYTKHKKQKRSASNGKQSCN